MMLAPQSFAGADSASTVGRNPVCSGPYKFVERVQNDRIVLQKFDKYYDAKNFSFDKVTFFAIPDSTVRLSNLRSGGIDILERANPRDVPRSEEHTSALQSLMRRSYPVLCLNKTITHYTKQSHDLN